MKPLMPRKNAKSVLNIRKAGAENMLEQSQDAIDIAAAQAQALQSIARGLDESLNGELRGNDREVGFMLMIFPFGDYHPANRASYVTNGAQRLDLINLLERQVEHLKSLEQDNIQRIIDDLKKGE